MNASDEDLKPKRGYLRRLPPEIEALRDRIVDRYTGQPLSEISAFVQKVLASEKNEVNRIAALAARVVLIRDHVNEVIRLNNPAFLRKAPPTEVAVQRVEAPAEHVVMVATKDTKLQDGMRRVKIIEDSTVHDVLFPAGITVDVKTEDAERLTSSGKAEYIEVVAAETPDTDATDVVNHEAAEASGDVVANNADGPETLEATETAPEAETDSAEAAPDPDENNENTSEDEVGDSTKESAEEDNNPGEDKKEGA
jgi:hypothetical protein